MCVFEHRERERGRERARVTKSPNGVREPPCVCMAITCGRKSRDEETNVECKPLCVCMAVTCGRKSKAEEEGMLRRHKRYRLGNNSDAAAMHQIADAWSSCGGRSSHTFSCRMPGRHQITGRAAARNIRVAQTPRCCAHVPNETAMHMRRLDQEG